MPRRACALSRRARRRSTASSGARRSRSCAVSSRAWWRAARAYAPRWSRSRTWKTCRRRTRPLHVRLGDDDVRGRKSLDDACEHIALRGGIVAGDEPDQPWEPRQGALATLVEHPLRGQLLLQPFEGGEVRAEPEALDR